MKNSLVLSIFVIAYGSEITSTYAHVGHLGELAGHSHWVGIGAVVLAGAIAAAVGKFSEDKQDDVEESETEPTEEMA